MREALLALLTAAPLCVAVWWVTGCAAPIRDICAESLDTWVSGGYGDAQGWSEDTESWDMRAGFNVHWDLTGSCWDYSAEEGGDPPLGVKPGDPNL